jgi:large conductance mechanosensitive channel
MTAPTAQPEKKGFVAEFKEFINRGNLVEIAVAFVLGVAFKTVIDSIAGTPDHPGLIGGVIGAIFGGDQPNFSDKGVTVNGSFIPIGGFVQACFNFLLTALVLFFIIRAYNKMRRNEPDETEKEIDILTEIRDELRTRNP